MRDELFADKMVSYLVANKHGGSKSTAIYHARLQALFAVIVPLVGMVTPVSALSMVAARRDFEQKGVGRG